MRTGWADGQFILNDIKIILILEKQAIEHAIDLLKHE
jgi:hypothetical protein